MATTTFETDAQGQIISGMDDSGNPEDVRVVNHSMYVTSGSITSTWDNFVAVTDAYTLGTHIDERWSISDPDNASTPGIVNWYWNGQSRKIDTRTDDYGAAVVSISSGGITFPSQESYTWSGAASTNDDDVIYTSADVTGYNYHIVENRGAGTVDVQVTVDGTFNASQPSASVLLTDDVTTGGGIKVISIATNKTGILRGKFMNIRVSQAGATGCDVGTVVGLHGVE